MPTTMRYKQFPVVDPDGLEGAVIATSRFLDDADEKLIRMRDGQEFFVPANLLIPRENGSFTLTVSAREILRRAEPPRTAEVEVNDTIIPAIEERLNVEKRTVETGRIQIVKRVETSETVVDEPLVEQDYEIERVPVNRILDSPMEPRYEGETLVLPILEEVLVVEKRLVLREEMRITRRQREIHDPQTHSVRREHIEVERSR